ncbi:unnamed protein product [Linum trigynum]|uniref:Retroviral polymerase SH3-like domain-containing protein n=1 Tax=Linum trigynum TaxID=586398 RepID=A0AAV2F5S4_9ROSI
MNRLPPSVLGNQTPFEVLLGCAPSYHHLRNFECLVYTNDTSSGLDKFVERGRIGVFVRYPVAHKGYMVFFYLKARKVITSHDVRFVEDSFPYRERQLGLHDPTTAAPRNVPCGSHAGHDPFELPDYPHVDNEVHTLHDDADEDSLQPATDTLAPDQLIHPSEPIVCRVLRERRPP